MANEVRRANIFGLEVEEGDTVVDVGPGSGGDSLIAGGIGADVIAIDVDAGGLDRLSARMRTVPARSFRALVSDCDAGPLPLPDGVASVVLAKEVMEHLDDPRRFLAELARIGRPGARYLITVPDPASESLLRIVAPPGFWRKPGHIHVFEHDELDRMIAEAGLVVERRAATGFYGSMYWCLRLAVEAEGRPGGAGHPAPRVLAAWDEAWTALAASPRGAEVIGRLDQLVPKSQIVLARKPAPAARAGHAA